MPVLTCDAKGRVYLGEKVRAKYGDRFLLVQAPSEILLVPVPDDGVAALRRASRKLRGKTMKELKRAIAEQARQEVTA